MKRHIDLAGTSAILGVLFCWAVVPVLLRDLTRYVDAWTANGIRYPFAAVLYWPILFVAWRRGELIGELWRRTLPPAILSTGGQLLWAVAPYYLEASLIGFLIKASIIWAAAGAMILFPEERALLRSWRFYLGFVLASAGFVFLALSHGSSEARGSVAGVVIILLCSVFFGLYGVSVRYCLTGTRSLVAFGVVAQYVSLVTFTMMLVSYGLRESGGPPGVVCDLSGLLHVPLRAWCLLLGSSFLGIGLSHVFFYIAIHRIGATLATSSHLMTPFLTLALAYALLGETMTPAQWASGIVMIIGGGLLVLSQETIVRRRRLGEER